MSANDRHDRAQPGAKPVDDKAGEGGPSQGGRQQQQSGSGAGNQYGEGNYKATRDYDRGLKEHMKTHDVEREARDAAPRSEEEARQLEEAEREGRRKARDAGDSGQADPNDRPTRKG